MNRTEAKKRAQELVSRMTLPEKAMELLQHSNAIERLGVHSFDWWNEALHGVARADIATVFPQAIGLAASFDEQLVHSVAEVISDEARGKYNEFIRHGDRDIYKGLTFWSPNINIFRDPRWGRGQETYGEDPFLTGLVGCAFVTGLQGDGEFLKAAACAKHFAVHSGPEKLRHGFNAECSTQDLHETYLPAFEALVKQARVEGVMGAYNRTRGEVCCAHTELMDDILFGRWGFEGYYVSDCGAICDFHSGHHVTPDGPHSAALAIKHGCNINCGNAYENILLAVKQGLISEQEVDYNVVKAFTTRFMLGEFEEKMPFSDIPFEAIDSEKNRAVNLCAAQKSLVLLKNDGILPLSRESISSIAVIGPNAMNINALNGNYNGRASEYITVVDGIRRAAPGVRINYATGCDLLKGDEKLTSALSAAEHSDVTVLCLGLDESVEGEERNTDCDYGYLDRGDRKSISLPGIQLNLIEKISEVTDKIIVVIMAGSSVDIGGLRDKINAEIYAWYPGAQGGAAVAGLLFGDFSPSGRLPVTVYSEDEKLPDFCDYSMENRTYRFFRGTPVYPFGYGLSYTEFRYSDLKVTGKTEDSVSVSVTVENIGKRDADEITEVYASFSDSRVRTPLFQLCALKHTFIKSGESVEIKLSVPSYWMKAVNAEGERIAPDGTVTLFVGSHQPDSVSNKLYGNSCAEIQL